MDVHSLLRPTDIAVKNDEIADGDIVLLPDLGPSHCLLAIKAKFEGELRLRRLTRAPWMRLTSGEPFDLDEGLIEKNRQALAQPRYADNVAAALAIVNQSNDTIIPYYNPRFRLFDHYILGRTRQRELYRHSTLVSELSWKVIRVWYGADAPTPGNFVGLIFPAAAHGDLRAAWSPTHGSGLHSGVSLGRFPDPYQALDELIRFDLAATAEPPRAAAPAPVEDDAVPDPISYDPMLED